VIYWDVDNVRPQNGCEVRSRRDDALGFFCVPLARLTSSAFASRMNERVKRLGNMDDARELGRSRALRYARDE